MLKKLTAIFVLAAVTNAYAYSPVKQSFDQAAELKRTFDELNYKLNVEWDQQDTKYRNDALVDFEKDIADLQKQGLTSETLVQYTMEQIKDSKVRDDINSIAQIIHENKMSSDEARAFAFSKVNSLYANGTSWSGGRVHVRAVLIVAIIILAVCTLSTKGHHGKDGRDGQDGKDCPPEQRDHKGENNGYGNGDQDAPGHSCEHNNAENSGCVPA